MEFSLIVALGIGIAILEIGTCFVIAKLKQHAKTKSNIQTGQSNP